MSLYFIIQNLAPVFYKILYMSLTAAAAGVVVVLARRLADKRFSPFWRYALWGLVVAALLIPWRPASVFSVMRPAEELQKTSFISDYNSAEKEYRTELEYRNVFISSDEFLYTDDKEGYSLVEQTERVKMAKKKADSLQIKTLIFDLLFPALWLLGTAAVAFFLLFSGFLLNKRIKNTTLPIENERYNIILEKCRTKLKIKRQVYIILQNHVKTPALFGLFRPKIILPEFAGSLSDEHLEYIILHELSHLKRGDGVVNALLLALQAVYWFNPLIWLFFKLTREDMELANDAAILKNMNNEERKEYSVSLVKTLAEYNKQRSFVPRLLCMVDNEKNIARRINMIKLCEFFRRRRLIIAVSGLLIITLTATLFLTVGRSTPIDEVKGVNIGSCEKNGFILKIYSDKEKYTPADEIKIWATLEYTGSGNTKRIWHSDPYISFSIIGENGFESNGLVKTILTSSILKKNQIYSFDYKKSGSWDADDPNAEFWEEFHAEEKLKLPAGEYTVAVSGEFSLTEDITESESGLLCELPIKVVEEILESESEKIYFFENPSEKDYMEKPRQIRLYDNGTAEISNAPTSSLAFIAPQYYSVVGDELIIVDNTRKNEVARFEIIDYNTLKLQSGEQLNLTKGTPFVHRPFKGTISIIIQKNDFDELCFNLFNYEPQTATECFFGPYKRIVSVDSLNKVLSLYHKNKISSVYIKHSSKFTKFEIFEISEKIIIPSKSYSLTTGVIDDLDYTPVPPEFADLSLSLNTLKTRPVDTDGWEILFSNSKYLYITYKLGHEFIFRYNIKQNKIDRALNVNISGEQDWSTNTVFFAEGDSAYIYPGIPVVYSSTPLFPKFIYLVNFEKNTVTLASKDSSKFTLPEEANYYKEQNSGSYYDAAARQYLSLIKKNPALPALPSDWCSVSEIEPDIYLLIVPKDEKNAWPGGGYADFKIIIVNTKNNVVIQTYIVE